MTFASQEVRHSFHKLSAADQVLFHTVWRALTEKGFFCEIAQVDSEIILRLTRKPVAAVPVDGLND